MGNEYSSPRGRDDDYDDDTAFTGASGFSFDREKLRKTANRGRRDGQQGSFFDSICGKMVYDDDYENETRTSKSTSRRNRSGSEEFSDDETYDSSIPQKRKDAAKIKSTTMSLAPNKTSKYSKTIMNRWIEHSDKAGKT